jgi:hypothetical protein
MIARMLALLLVLALGAIAAAAQDSTPPAPAAAVGAVDFPWDTITAEWIERRYKVEAVRFKARDETGTDWPGSDEVVVGTVDANGFTVSGEIGGIDSGDTHDFDPAVSCIIGVPPGIVALGRNAACDPAGVAGPLGFRVELREKDTSPFSEACLVLGADPGEHAGAHCLDDGSGDDFIGWRRLFFPIPDLEAMLPNVGDGVTETVALFPCPEGTDVCGGWDFADYSFTYRITRLADVRTDFRSELMAAMERSHIANAGDAIAAGLRSLAAPVERRGAVATGATLAQN